MARKKKTVLFKVSICKCGHGKDLHRGECTIGNCNCIGYRFDREVVRSKEVFQ
jgi:hypothetical protein